MRRTVPILLCAVLLVAPACGSGTGTSGGDDVAEGAGSSLTDAPEPEPSEENEAPDEADSGAVAVQLPGLPVGGDSESVSATHQCVDVGWSEPPDIPSWIEIRLTGVTFTPPGDFALSSQRCPGDAPRCDDEDFRLTNTSRCALAVKWTRTTQDGPARVLFTGGTILCPADRAVECGSFRRKVEDEGPQALQLNPSPDGFPAEEAGEGSSDDPTSGPTDEATETTEDTTEDSADGSTDGSSEGSGG